MSRWARASVHVSTMSGDGDAAAPADSGREVSLRSTRAQSGPNSKHLRTVKALPHIP